MADDQFWKDDMGAPAAVAGQWYATTMPGGGLDSGVMFAEDQVPNCQANPRDPRCGLWPTMGDTPDCSDELVKLRDPRCQDPCRYDPLGPDCIQSAASLSDDRCSQPIALRDPRCDRCIDPLDPACNYGMSVALGTSPSFRKVYTVKHAKPPLRHSHARFAAHPGRPRAMKPGEQYRATGLVPKLNLTRVSTAYSALPLKKIVSETALPENFSFGPQDLTEGQAQGKCGSCWAFALAHMLADRVCLQTSGKVRAALSTQQIMECSDYLAGCEPVGCDGNDDVTACESLKKKGIKLHARDQYPRKFDGTNSSTSNCQGYAHDIMNYGVSLSDYYAVCEVIGQAGDATNLKNIQNMKQHIFNEGPLIAAINATDDFSSNYDGTTIYSSDADPSKINHAIEILGWGKDPETNTEYWVCRNSWGDTWPVNHRKCAGKGFFYMKLGTNICGIESYAVGAQPSVTNGSYAPRGGNAALDTGADCTYQHLTANSGLALHDITPKGIAAKVGLGLVVLLAVGGAIWYVTKKKQ